MGFSKEPRHTQDGQSIKPAERDQAGPTAAPASKKILSPSITPKLPGSPCSLKPTSFP